MAASHEDGVDADAEDEIEAYHREDGRLAGSEWPVVSGNWEAAPCRSLLNVAFLLIYSTITQ